MKFFVFLSVLFLVLPKQIYPAYIDTRDLTPEIKKVQRLIGSKRNQYGVNSAAAISAAVLAVGAGIAIAGAYTPTYHYRPHHHYRQDKRYRRYYHRPYSSAASALGGTLALIGVANAINSAAQAEAINNDNNSIEEQIAEILKNLVYTDQDYVKEIKELNIKLSNQEIVISNQLDQRTEKKLNKLYAPSNQMELDYEQKISNIDTKYDIYKFEKSIQSLSNQLLGFEPTIMSRKEIQADIKFLLKAMKKTKKEIAKETKILNKNIKKERKFYAKTLSKPINEVLQNQEQEYNLFIEKSSKEVNNLFQRYYSLYHNRIM